jgi:hypothetical protein
MGGVWKKNNGAWWPTEVLWRTGADSGISSSRIKGFVEYLYVFFCVMVSVSDTSFFVGIIYVYMYINPPMPISKQIPALISPFPPRPKKNSSAMNMNPPQ